VKIQYDAIAQSVLGAVQKNFLPEHEYVLANPRAFADLDLSFYQITQASLEGSGFVLVADVEDKTISEFGAIKTFIRVMRHPQSAAIAAMYYVPPLQRGFLEFESLFSDRHFLLDTGAPAGNSVAVFPSIDAVHYPPGVPADEMHAAHAARVRSYQASKRNAEALHISSFDDIVQAQNLMNRTKHDHLASIGWVTLEYLEQQSGGNTELAAGVYAAIQGILSGESSGSSEAEHALIVHFSYGRKNLDALFALEDKLEKAVAKLEGAVYDGHEVAVDGSDGRLYLYGPDADQLSAKVVPVLKKAAFMKGARIVKRYGPPKDGVREEESKLDA
jgi:hypothetical protein